MTGWAPCKRELPSWHAVPKRRPSVRSSFTPIAIKYWFLQDPRPTIHERLAALEQRLTWRPQVDLDLPDRFAKLSGALLGIKEAEHLGQALTGDVGSRITQLTGALLTGIESSLPGRVTGGDTMARVREITRQLVPKLPAAVDRPQERERLWRDLDKAWLCQLLFGHDQAYLRQNPSLERLAEELWRLEEDWLGVDQPLAPVGVVISVGQALSVADFPDRRRSTAGRREDALTAEIGLQIQQLLDEQLRQGPPPQWPCPTVV